MFYESNEQAGQRLAEFKENPAIQSLAKGDDPKWVRGLELQKLRFGKLAIGRVYLTSDESADGKQREVRLVLERSSPQGLVPASWRVANFDFADSAASGG